MGSSLTGDQLTWARGVNIVQAVLNMLHGGGGQRASFITAAQTRVQARLKSGLESMMVDFEFLDKEGVQEFLKHHQHYAGGGAAIPLGERGGVPTSAATVDLHGLFEERFPELALQVNEPKALLLPSRRRPVKIKRGHVWLHASYPNLVRKNMKAGLHGPKKLSQVAKHRGKLCLTGAFAVAKDATEDRVITDPAVNQLLDPDRLPRPRFAYIPKMRVTYAPRTGKLLVSKRDARHYFHSLRIGHKWMRWLCGPPITGVNGRLVYPAARTAPMGFGPSAGWAQAVTDLATEKGGLPDGRRVVPDSYPPSELPVWGSICDDIWALEHEGSGPDSLMGPRWMAAAEEAWQSFGVHPNPKKAVNADVDQEIQGIYVDSGKHWMGVSFPKRQKLLQAAVHLLAEPWVLLADVERLVGKFGYVHSCRPILRSVFAETYRWLDNNRSQGIRRAVLSDEIWIEILSASVLLPFAQFDLSADFSNRVECTDASMTGIGRAWATMPTSLVQLMAQVCDHNGTYTNMSLPHGIGLTEQGTCPLKKLNFPHQRFHWHQIGAPANPRFIYLGEADAATWSAEDRLRRPGDDGKRFVHPMDSASCVGAFNKGRSASFLLNCRCQRLCAIGVAGGHEVFYPWIPSGDNPADAPSRWYGTVEEEISKHKTQDKGDDGLPALETLFVDPFTLRDWTGNERVFVHLCAGVQRDGDLVSCIGTLADDQGFHIVGIRVDPLVQQREAHRALGRGRQGPRPVRSRQRVWQPLANLSEREKDSVYLGSALSLLCVGFLGETRAGTDATMFRCDHSHRHEPLTGIDPVTGAFRTTVAAKYPVGMSMWLGNLFLARYAHAVGHGYTMPFAPTMHAANHTGLDPYVRTVLERFLMSALRDTTKEKYQNALQFLNNELQTAGIQWGKLSEVQQDYFLAEWMVDGYEQGLGRAEFGSLLSALGRINPRVRYKVAWKVFEVWGKLKPPQQAAAAPPELITAMMVACFALNRADLGLLICICFAGLLRVGEALQLRWKDVFLSPSGVTLCLGVTKNGIEQQVLLTNQVVADWVVQFRARASELTRRGVPFADVMLFGRWSSDRAAREYVRQGEVAILRTAEALGPGVQNEYWDLRYKVDPEPFEWLRNYKDLGAFLSCEKSADILHVGCGNSLITEQMYDDGYQNIINIDTSPVVITQMMERNFGRPKMIWLEMDALDMSLPDNAFDLIIDKSLMDTFACSEELAVTIITYLMEVSRVLRTGGVLLVISYGAPETRLDFLKMSHLKFEVEVVTLEATDMQKEHYLYRCTKQPHVKKRRAAG
ncbi:eEF1A lysine and N-terminal methyltransferase (eEF1A-KNMT) (Methyltransferase-like protein 13) [Includes: eEF1A lysine methyltransferase [Durusdinium trenchii]|uniref:EEF1A lysine and N-terminal methyltransferase (EEF1A-KNMT) (Methyltransferase-like protein 13) n=1 Tax=Durusdinium trenchii TaxID=1381693 RepID=A0ABP0R964_9DINO